MRTIEERLWPRVDKTDTCWVWKGALNKGYGLIGNKKVHRVVYELLVGPIPEGLQLDHLCRNRACCNPDHLEPVTGRENVLRGVGPTAANAKATHCANGHPYTPENTYVRPSRPTERECRTCRGQWLADYRGHGYFSAPLQQGEPDKGPPQS